MTTVLDAAAEAYLRAFGFDGLSQQSVHIADAWRLAMLQLTPDTVDVFVQDNPWFDRSFNSFEQRLYTCHR